LPEEAEDLAPFLSGHYEFFVFLPLAGVFRKPGAKVKIK
jgi:hypothetical protein